MTDRTPRGESTGDLLGQIVRRQRHIWAHAAAPLGVSPHQVRALRVICEAPIRPGTLAERLHIAPRSATDVVDALEQGHLIVRAPDPGDRRAVVLDATPEGRDTLAQVLTARDRAVADWLDRLSEHDRAELHRILGLLTADD